MKGNNKEVTKLEKLQDALFLPRAMDITAEITAIKALLQASRLIDKD